MPAIMGSQRLIDLELGNVGGRARFQWNRAAANLQSSASSKSWALSAVESTCPFPSAVESSCSGQSRVTFCASCRTSDPAIPHCRSERSALDSGPCRPVGRAEQAADTHCSENIQQSRSVERGFGYKQQAKHSSCLVDKNAHRYTLQEEYHFYYGAPSWTIAGRTGRSSPLPTAAQTSTKNLLRDCHKINRTVLSWNVLY
jgi:hypothetical protein